MQKNIEYSKGKKLLENFYSNMDKLIADLQTNIDIYENAIDNPDDVPELALFSYSKAVKLKRTYSIIKNDLQPTERNLFCTYLACDYDYKKTLEIFNGENKGYKNIATLRVIIANIRKIIKEKYKEKYGSN